MLVSSLLFFYQFTSSRRNFCGRLHYLLHSTISVDNFSPPLICCVFSKPAVSFLNKCFEYFHSFLKGNYLFLTRSHNSGFHLILNRSLKMKPYLVCHDFILLYNTAGNAITMLKKSLGSTPEVVALLRSNPLKTQENMVLCAFFQRYETIQGCYNDLLLYENPR